MNLAQDSRSNKLSNYLEPVLYCTRPWGIQSCASRLGATDLYLSMRRLIMMI